MKSRRKIIRVAVFTIISTFLVSCGDETVPKPQAYLRLDYPIEDNHVMYDGTCPFTFEFNSQSIMKSKGNCNFTLEYPKMKGTIHLTYKPVSDNIEVLLRDAQKLTYEHVIKANTIKELPFSNGLENVHGMFYQVGGNAATNAQFYVTDSTNHFLTGSIYFHTKPNYDSIMPAVSYIKEDMQNIMETIKWKK
ncbi:MAG: gliding motility lipoprotein GldD [Flavobacterium sp. MedPE-SWcel]|uniref:gliding motility lipoprotein GldD n=1 Tax=uncultured Flavobacterium sp. TaxID=165435 RepID=UPI0009204E76|nr:gliding motility lipoprotein GldD [uncultured Flavobacterium sp.]OIQ17657.1 MAG: gliding motility lipoprotein GldD [Flavobacterium sp. MedPE-SWcel]